MRLTYGEFVATVAKIEKINARAAKKGFTGTLTVESTEVKVTETNAIGFEVTEIFYDVTISGEPPKYNGWTLLAVLDFDAESGLIVRSAPGASKVEREGLKAGWCDHCKTVRLRNKTYLVGNDDGSQVQVGSTCIKDFLGWSASPVFFTDEDVSREISENLSGGHYERRWDVSTILAASWASIQVHGFRPASSYDGTTKGHVMSILDPFTKWEKEEAAKLRPYVDQSYAQAKVIRDWLLSSAFSGDTDYVINMKAVAGATTASMRNIGLLASAPQTWAKAQERDLVRRKEAKEIVSEWVGAEKDKLELTVTIKSIRFIDGQYGTTTLYTLLADTGHVFKWFASSKALGTETDGKVYRIKGTVKKHDEYNGLKSTVLTRCKVQ